ncbi:2-hydroxyacid dehydrogenase [Ketogulonicigenium vulgare]|uniref:D-isomer specific 2-hydroxyacid dehydrogenase family protein n=1 Tax=Ketogulonicigenium vulgare (strain WSH-001) TaxID=759362 RepID=F9Y9V8_KETVW|nr:D-glycerate dehydrogenase [Ketogulonicigenium vulgare]ADO41990.1 glyoxylate reductase [Ketogulonicigenium vulgare Y25]AEM40210.1 D-isomer specific 2-hydroxyacid dehydrogenase family protein [Ketogulonicigenium vulgare WSH-001]ALJ80412.1 D-glycerate dehydrogenase [Ketogulonicigenium vulgare]ANW33242.1 D-glycerate dehydrogenase [Ketogulonicigenium vulgare]AOZ53914.1 glyoxylate reductase [Ketogulonicigenium vulgare]
MKLFISRLMPDGALARARAQYDVTLRAEATKPLTEDEMVAALTTHDALLVTLGDRLTQTVFERAKAAGLRAGLIANFGVGFNHIDVTAARAAGVEVTNTPGAVTDATADIAMTLILMTCRRAAEGERLARSGEWQGWGPVEMLGQHVTGKTVGIVGFGRIGQAIAQRCHYGFGMDVVYYNRSAKEAAFPARKIDDLHALMGAADIVVVAVPGGNPDLIDADALGAMKPTGVLVNIARGDVVNQDALIEVLQRGAIAGAGLDVYRDEPSIPASLRALDNAVLLPHLGTSTHDARAEMGAMVLDNIDAFAAGQPLPNRV